MKRKFDCTIGIDEVGRGPLAGPVCVCAVALSKEKEMRLLRCARSKNEKRKFADSKKLTAIQREYWAVWRQREQVPFALSYVRPATIDKMRIHHAVNRAAQRAYHKVLAELRREVRKPRFGTVSSTAPNLTNSAHNESRVIADAGIKVNAPNFKSFPKADETVPAVALASIIAKLHRDRYMSRLHKKHPAYGFVVNKGYGTRGHTAALIKHGPSTAHRLTFIRNYTTLKKK
ncbi:hypothetical protein A2755_02675 [Candidatus Wolfebacteria bacterium RIFCSPHIGHO2_01_FULL_48_22]|uniref:Ribonuclease n=2 Tax=Candidatus Wolfeibacteriota TaxID=1752735 RepID=A0A1F8DRK9_9BACT|nr:MAG: hypothetical protein A2755_02675 [Candidatus Wolfebacteria bacterium RIFCSPHIGHO2_01_FULL_48_22]OGM92224.1 MAG: hypothetical protein A2935_00390 [Candidatus Wolfebacteria bacterium RIFCSPLOWO2_01_FULL_47_17b]